jgi:uncharacterized protein Yka (UPF0111/DUF47 family)
VDKLVADILDDMSSPNYVPVEAEALVLIAHALDRIANALEEK